LPHIHIVISVLELLTYLVLPSLIFQEQQQAESGAPDEAAEPFMGSGRFGIVSAPCTFHYFLLVTLLTPSLISCQ